MTERPGQPLSNAARTALACVCVLSLIGCALILAYGGFFHTQKYSRDTTFVGGAGAMLVGVLMFLLSALAAFSVVQSFRGRLTHYLLTVAALLLALYEIANRLPELLS